MRKSTKGLLINLCLSFACVGVFIACLNKSQTALFSTGNLSATHIFVSMGLGVIGGILIELTDAFGTGKSRRRGGINYGILLGQGVPAVFLGLNPLIIGLMSTIEINLDYYGWFGKWGSELSLVGFVWLGITLCKTVKYSFGKFHVKQRRR
ncbi:MAG: hypothetical protein PHT78_01360 [Desulfitobacteriaceae bacterium]|nr:hypothetical protein [Desulfitobacteriaceae bacterium]MDD4751886.1 hypothetical protein [Desulfitobacteriaceae bacterium]